MRYFSRTNTGRCSVCHEDDGQHREGPHDLADRIAAGSAPVADDGQVSTDPWTVGTEVDSSPF